MKQQLSFDGIAAESLYDFDKIVITDLNVVISDDFYNIIQPRPSLIPGVEYPISAKEECLLDLAWQHAVKLKSRGWI